MLFGPSLPHLACVRDSGEFERIPFFYLQSSDKATTRAPLASSVQQ